MPLRVHSAIGVAPYSPRTHGPWTESPYNLMLLGNKNRYCAMPTPSETKLLKQFGNNVRAERQKIGLSQEELADKADLDRSYVGGVERGERNISLINIVKLAKAIGVAPAQLLKSI